MLKLRVFPDPILREKAIEVTDFSQVQEKSQQMIKIMEKHQGIGLAANQAGLLERIFVMKLSKDSEPQVFINPVITSRSAEKYKYEEGCLSLPGINAVISRPKTITLEWTTLQGERKEQQFDSLASTCIQHEIDHLNGKLFPDNVKSPVKQQKIWKDYQAFLRSNL